ncbi:hypothetical protein C1646_740766 [Rhizophagus diaphanus]|nr:hypothetical protein C1646_740766 [Rhizophagus diaphanus] [Rhizophagus sp. MUCL 43196]
MIILVIEEQEGDSKRLSKVFEGLQISSNNDIPIDYKKETTQQMKGSVNDDDEIHNNPNLHPEDQDDFEIPDDCRLRRRSSWNSSGLFSAIKPGPDDRQSEIRSVFRLTTVMPELPSEFINCGRSIVFSLSVQNFKIWVCGSTIIIRNGIGDQFLGIFRS